MMEPFKFFSRKSSHNGQQEAEKRWTVIVQWSHHYVRSSFLFNWVLFDRDSLFCPSVFMFLLWDTYVNNADWICLYSNWDGLLSLMKGFTCQLDSFCLVFLLRILAMISRNVILFEIIWIVGLLEAIKKIIASKYLLILTPLFYFNWR